MKLHSRSLVAMVLLFTASAVAMLWGLSERAQTELRTQVMLRAEQRAVQLANAMAGKMAAEFALLDHVLLEARSAWLLNPQGMDESAATALARLPAGLVSHLTVVDAQGQMIYNSLAKKDAISVEDRASFQAAQSGPDSLLIGAPVVSRLTGAWLVPVSRPLMRDGLFAGEIHLAVSADFLAQQLARLTLAAQDVVILMHPSARVVAHSSNNAGTLGKPIPLDRPFYQAPSDPSGTYREAGAVDRVPRLFGWSRLPDTGLVTVVGLAEASVLAPLQSTIERSVWLTSLLSLMLLAGGGAVAALLWQVDRSSAALRESERQLKDAQRMAKLGYWTFDYASNELVWSDEVYRIYGKQQGVDIPTYEGFLNSVHPLDRDSVSAGLRGLVKAGGALEQRLRIVTADGSEKHLLAQAVADRKGGRTVRTHGTVQDITEVRVAQLELEKLNDELEMRVASRTRELAALNSELESFSYSVSHDLRTPLRSIHGFAALLEEEGESLSAEGRAHLRRIQDGARRMGLLITDLLTMAHHSRAVVNLERVNLSELAQSVAAELERSERSRAMQWAIEPGLWAMADPLLVRVVLQNLLGNAWKYTGQTPLPQISLTRVAGDGSDGMVQVCVRDNGAGFDMAFVDQLFKPFKRLHAHHEFEGTGIGLASVHRLIQRHGGSVRAEGAVGQGAAIYFTLPAP